MLSPIRKNEATASYSSRMSSTSFVVVVFGPSSNVKAITFFSAAFTIFSEDNPIAENAVIPLSITAKSFFNAYSKFIPP